MSVQESNNFTGCQLGHITLLFLGTVGKILEYGEKVNKK